MVRRLENWINSFELFTHDLSSPSLFKKWGGIMAVAGALERKVWVTTVAGDLFPNMFCVLVGPAGVGKTVITNRVRKFWLGLDDHHVASTSVTKASLMDELEQAERRGVALIGKNKTEPFHFHSLKILANELGVLIPGYDNDFMNVLTDVWDGHVYSENRRSTKRQFKIDKPQLNLFAATTPSYLNEVMPAGAWTQGFISRVLLIYSGETAIRPLFGSEELNEELNKKLLGDLIHIGKLYGKMEFTPEAAEAITAWHTQGGPPTPDHPRLIQGYNVRRSVQLLKLCMVACAASADDYLITIEHFAMALDWLMEAEVYMPDIFKAMSGGSDGQLMDETYHFVYKLFIVKKQPISEQRIIAFIQQRTPAHNVEKILQVMVKAGLLKLSIGTDTVRAYSPGTRA